RVPTTGTEARGRLEESHGLVAASEPSVDLRGEPMTLYVLRAGPENGLDLGQGPGEVLPGHQRLGQDEARGGVMGVAHEAVAADVDGVVHAAGLPVEIREQREAERGRLLRQPLLVTADGGGQRELRRGGAARVGRRRLARHRVFSTIEASAARTSAGATS